MHDLFSLKHCICAQTDLINASMAQPATGSPRGGFLCLIVVQQTDLYEYLDLAMKKTAFLVLPRE